MSKFVADTFYNDHNKFVPQIAPFVYDWVGIAAAYNLLKGERNLDHLVIDEAQNLPAGLPQMGNSVFSADVDRVRR